MSRIATTVKTATKTVTKTVKTDKEKSQKISQALLLKRLEGAEDAIEYAMDTESQAVLTIGRNFCEIRKDRLYKSDGYKTFSQYLDQKWNLTRMSAYNYMKLSESILSQAQIVELGLGISYIVASAEGSDQPDLIRVALKTRDIEEVKQLAEKFRARDGKKRSKGRSASAKKTLKKNKAEKRIAVSTEVEKYVVDMVAITAGQKKKAGYKKQATTKLNDGRTLKVYINATANIVQITIK